MPYDERNDMIACYRAERKRLLDNSLTYLTCVKQYGISWKRNRRHIQRELSEFRKRWQEYLHA